MRKIQLLDSKTINKIAAGEVVESPKSVVKELTENAIDAGASAVTVEIKEGGVSYIRVTDNGCGIPQERLKDIFLGYSLNESAPADGRNNAGIGLSVCAAIIKAHGGEIRAQNVRGGGSAFRFYLNMGDDINE